MKIIILIALRGVKFPEGGAAAPVAPPLDTPLYSMTIEACVLGANTASLGVYNLYRYDFISLRSISCRILYIINFSN